jgi:hypothetical protein
MASPPPPKDGIDFNALPWNLNLPDELKYVHVTTTSEWGNEHKEAIATSVKRVFHNTSFYHSIDDLS